MLIERTIGRPGSGRRGGRHTLRGDGWQLVWLARVAGAAALVVATLLMSSGPALAADSGASPASAHSAPLDTVGASMPTPPGLPARPRGVALPKGVPAPGTSVSPPGAKSNWSVQPTSNTPNLEPTNLSSVSCTATNACEAVGDYFDGGKQLTLAEGWNGTTWSVQPSANPNASNALNAVSCTAATACEAVGSIYNGEDSYPLAEVWNGAVWTSQYIPNPSGSTYNELESVSCTASDACMAVGYSYIDSEWSTLAEALSGSNWTIESTQNPGDINYLYGVSCTAADACVAVGDFDCSSYCGLVEVWNGTNWSDQSMPNPSGVSLTFLDGVSCTATDACEAVGEYYVGEDTVTLAESWNGTTWSEQSTPNPTGATGNALEGVSCTATDACIGDGWYSNGSQTLPLAEDWNGSTWMIESLYDSFGNSGLSGVSCSSASACQAVGNYEDGAGDYPLAYVWNGSQLAFQIVPNGASSSSLASVSCTAADACVAVGYSLPLIGSDYSPLAETWNGTSWALMWPPPPNPNGSSDTYLESVSCTTGGCMAVGQYWNGSAYQSLAEDWNGSSWTLEPTSNPGSSTELLGVSCTAANACEAVGTYSNGSDYDSLVEVWNGTAWSDQSSPNPAKSLGTYLDGISCTAAGGCEAVGSYYKASGVYYTLAETWNGTSWAIQSSPSHKGASSFLGKVSCSATDACVAVGTYDKKSGTVLTLAESWNGTSWAINSSPNPGKAGSALDGVSCSGESGCVAVGYYDTDSGSQALAESWNGTTWASSRTAIPSAAIGSSLAGDWCNGVSACVAVGSYSNISGVSLTLAEAEGGD